MKFTIINCEQGSEAWLQARAGRLTSSAASDMQSKIKSGEAAGRRNLRVRLVCERLTGRSLESDFCSREMRRGKEFEQRALAEYEAVRGVLVRTTGFLRSDELMVGASLDGDVNNFEGIIELKCPNSATHLDYIRRKRLPPEYVHQVEHELWVSGAQWCDFVSFDDRFPESLQFFCVRVHRDELNIPTHASLAVAFLSEVDRETRLVQKMALEAAA